MFVLSIPVSPETRITAGFLLLATLVKDTLIIFALVKYLL